MANKVFISFRFSDGNKYKEELSSIFSNDVEVINCSENEDRSNLSEPTIQKYLYDKLKNTSVTVVLITPEAVSHQKNAEGKYDDWMHDEIRYSLEDRENNRCNGLIGVYVPEAENSILKKTTCNKCTKKCKLTSVYDFENLVRKNMMNVYPGYKKNPCDGVYDSDYDSYCTLVSYEDFKENYLDYIKKADEKRGQTHKYDIKKNLNKQAFD
mgnify:CR=1 FL=1